MEKEYRPIFYQKSKNFLAENFDLLKNFINKEINDYYLLWGVEDNCWFQTQPVILVIENNHYEFLFDNLSDFSLTKNQINTKDKFKWYEEEEVEVIWKNNCNKDFDMVLNKKIQKINLIEMILLKGVVENDKKEFIETGDNSVQSLAGIEFIFEDTLSLTIYNGLNENSITLENISNIFHDVKKIKV